MRQAIITGICIVVLIAVTATVTSAVDPDGKYRLTGKFAWKFGNHRTTGTFKGSAQLDGRNVRGVTRATDECKSVYELTLNRAPGGSGTSVRTLTGTIKDICPIPGTDRKQTTTYRVINGKGTVTIKLTSKGVFKFTGRTVANGVSGPDSEGTLISIFKGVKR